VDKVFIREIQSKHFTQDAAILREMVDSGFLDAGSTGALHPTWLARTRGFSGRIWITTWF
jgi:hypothetical protein